MRVDSGDVRAMRITDVVRFGYGLALLADPQRVARTLTRTELDRRGQVTARVLGARHVVQAAVLVCGDRAQVRRASRVVDLLHASSMLVLAAWAPGRGRAALSDAAVAALLAGTAGAPKRGPSASQQSQEPSTSPESTSDRIDLPPLPPELGGSLAADPDAGDLGVRRQREAGRQAAVYEAFGIARGGTMQRARAALVQAMGARGLPLPPAPWLDAVASDIAAGNIYIVSGPAMQDVGLQLPPHEPI
jgi:hypothetical protein